MKLERFKTDKKDVLRSAGYALAIGSTLFGSYHGVKMLDATADSFDDFARFENSSLSEQTPIPATEDEKVMHRRIIKNPHETPTIISLTPDQQYYLHEAENDRLRSEKHMQKGAVALPIVLPTFFAALIGKTKDKENFFAFRRTA